MGRSWHLEWIPEILYAGSTNHHHLTWQWKNHHNTIQRSGLFKRLSLITGRATPPFCLMGLFSKWPGQKCCVIQILGCANPSKEQLLNGSVQTYNNSPTHKKPFFESLKSLLSPTNHICNEVGDCPNWLNNKRTSTVRGITPSRRPSANRHAWLP